MIIASRGAAELVMTGTNYRYEFADLYRICFTLQYHDQFLFSANNSPKIQTISRECNQVSTIGEKIIPDGKIAPKPLCRSANDSKESISPAGSFRFSKHWSYGKLSRYILQKSLSQCLKHSLFLQNYLPISNTGYLTCNQIIRSRLSSIFTC